MWLCTMSSAVERRFGGGSEVEDVVVVVMGSCERVVERRVCRVTIWVDREVSCAVRWRILGFVDAGEEDEVGSLDGDVVISGLDVSAWGLTSVVDGAGDCGMVVMEGEWVFDGGRVSDGSLEVAVCSVLVVFSLQSVVGRDVLTFALGES